MLQAAHQYDEPCEYDVLVKAINILGNDTTKNVRVRLGKMDLFRMRPQDITEAEINSQVGEKESYQLDVKEYAYPSPPKDRQFGSPQERTKAHQEWRTKLCTDIVAMANGRGGVILLGLKDDGEGTISEVVGLGTDYPFETEIMRLEQAAHQGIEPPVQGLHIEPIELEDKSKGLVLVVHIPRSLNAPHRIKYDGRFVVRHSIENLDMDIHEIRSAFVAGASYIEKARDFRDARVRELTQVSANSLSTPLVENPACIVHAIPLGHFDERSFDLSLAFARRGSGSYTPRTIDELALNGEFNLFGFTFNHRLSHHSTSSHVQVFRTGVVEYASAWIQKPDGFDVTQLFVDVSYLENYIAECAKSALLIGERIGVSPPILFSAILTGVAGKHIAYPEQARQYRDDGRSPAIVNLVTLPEITTASFPDDIQLLLQLKPMFDALANAAGRATSPRYREDGTIHPPFTLPQA